MRHCRLVASSGGGQHALNELLAAQGEAGVNHVALNLKPTRRDALDLFQSRTEVFIHRRAVTGAGCITGRNGSFSHIRATT
jgi:hypothetical protein